MGRRALLAACVGNFVEWYDFVAFGFLATVLAGLFFPPDDPVTALLGTFAIYGVTFLARPFGGVFFGNRGDRRGRRDTLTATILLMGAATTAMGLLPTYAQVGVLAPILLLVLRLLQGFSAGGEYIGSLSLALEYAPPQRRGLWVGIVVSSVVVASLSAALTVLLLSTFLGDAFTTWGWRLPFLFGGIIAVAGLFLRRRLAETPAFRELARRHDTTRAAPPALRAIRDHRRSVVLVACLFAFSGLVSHTALAYLPTYLAGASGLDRDQALLSSLLAYTVGVVLVPCFGLLSDRVGRKPILLAAAASFIVFTVPVFWLAGSGGFAAALVAQMVLIAMLSLTSAGGDLLSVELFPTAVRYSAAAIALNVAFAVFGGTAPLVGALLASTFDTDLAPAFYLVLMAAVALAATLALPETAHRPLDGDDPAPGPSPSPGTGTPAVAREPAADQESR